ncbi:MAG: hypothetical protein ACK4NV_14765 [Pannonibacter sp.]
MKNFNAGLYYIAGSVFLLIIFKVIFSPSVEAIRCSSNLCQLAQGIFEFQTLIGAGLAILAAQIAAKPVWLQLRRIEQQIEISAISHLEARISALKSKKSEYDRVKTKLISYINKSVFIDNGFEVEFNAPNVHVAHDIHIELGGFRVAQVKIGRDHMLADDSEEKLSSLKEETRLLDDALYDIFGYAANIGDPDVSDEELSVMKEKSQVAPGLLEAKCYAFSRAIDEFDEAFEADIERQRKKIKEILEKALS